MINFNRLIFTVFCAFLGMGTAQAAEYRYDKLHRLTSVTYESGQVVSYAYDPAGNLLRVDLDGGTPRYSVLGVITDAEGNPLAGAQVTLNGQTLTTGTDGVYRFNELAAGEYTLSVSLDGWLTQTRRVALTEDHPSLNLAFTLLPRPPVSTVLFAGVQSCANNSRTVSANRIRVYHPDGRFIRDFDSGFSGKGVLLSAANFNADQAGDVVATQLAQGEALRTGYL